MYMYNFSLFRSNGGAKLLSTMNVQEIGSRATATLNKVILIDCLNCFFLPSNETALALYRGHPGGRCWRIISQNYPTSPFFKLRKKWFYIGYIERIHFSSKLQKTVKTLPLS